MDRVLGVLSMALVGARRRGPEPSRRRRTGDRRAARLCRGWPARSWRPRSSAIGRRRWRRRLAARLPWRTAQRAGISLTEAMRRYSHHHVELRPGAAASIAGPGDSRPPGLLPGPRARHRRAAARPTSSSSRSCCSSCSCRSRSAASARARSLSSTCSGGGRPRATGRRALDPLRRARRRRQPARRPALCVRRRSAVAAGDEDDEARLRRGWLAGALDVSWRSGSRASRVPSSTRSCTSLAVLPGVPLGIALFGRRHPAAWIGGALFGYGLTQLASGR